MFENNEKKSSEKTNNFEEVTVNNYASDEITNQSQQERIVDFDPKLDNYKRTLITCLFAGVFGFHRFFNGKVGTGLLMLVTCGGCGIWMLIDYVKLTQKNFTDGNGEAISYEGAFNDLLVNKITLAILIFNVVVLVIGMIVVALTVPTDGPMLNSMYQ